MANYPYVSPQDENSQYLTSILSQYKPGQLGNTATIGNPQGQQDYASQLAQALAEMDSATKQQGRAEGMQGAKYIDNSGALGVLAVLAQTYAGKKMDEKASKKYEDASMRAMTAKDVLDEAKAERAAARALKATQGEQAQRRKDGEAMGLTGRDLTRYALEGKMGEGVRGVPMMTDQGLVNVDPYTGTAAPISNGPPQQHSQPSMPFDIKGDVPPEVAAAMQADPAAWENGNSIDIKPHGGALMPYKDPAIAQRQASADSRAERSLSLQEQSAGDARAAKQSAAEVKQQAAQARQAASTSAAQDLIDSIDRVTGSKGYGDLGTMWGDVKTHVPGVRNDAKDAQASLDNIGGQVALSTMATLKALSAQGATGFGALSKPELDLLKNSIAALQAGNLSHEALDANLKVVRSKMGRITSWQGDGQPSAPAAAPQPGHVLKYNPQTGKIE